MKRQGPMALCFLMGLAFITQFFIYGPGSEAFQTTVLKWFRVVTGFSLVLGTGSLIRLHATKIQRKRKDWQYSIIAMISLFVMIMAGVLGGYREGSLFIVLFEYVQIPLQATMFSILAFYIASAAYRAFRVRNVQASVLMVAAIIVMLGRVPYGQMLWWRMPDLTEWILAGPNMAAKRGIVIGVGLGMISTALKIILGIERSYLGGRD
jgi:FlaA1/EpsC-like NDP-sugar epimerase